MKKQDPSKSKPRRESPAPRKRFRLEKLEERIAPTPHFNPHTVWVGAGNDNTNDNNGGGGGGGGGGSVSPSDTIGGSIY